MKKIITIIVAIATFAIIVASILLYSNSASVRIRKELRLADKYLTEENYEQAIISFEAVIRIDPFCVEAYSGKSNALVSQASKISDEEEALDIMLQAYLVLTNAEEIFANSELSDKSTIIEGFVEKEAEIEGNMIKLLSTYVDKLREDKDFNKILELKEKYGPYVEFDFDSALLPLAETVKRIKEIKHITIINPGTDEEERYEEVFPYEYDEHNRLISYCDEEYDLFTYKYEIKYDELGRIISKTGLDMNLDSYSDDDFFAIIAPEEKWTYEYEDNCLKYETKYCLDVPQIRYEYNNEGQLVQERSNNGYIYKSCMDDEGALIRNYIYDEYGKKLRCEYTWYDNRGTITYEYDKDGNLISSNEINSDDAIEWEYNEKGQLISDKTEIFMLCDCEMGHEFFNHTSYEYDMDGDLLKKTYYYRECTTQCELYAGKVERIEIYEYIYEDVEVEIIEE